MADEFTMVANPVGVASAGERGERLKEAGAMSVDLETSVRQYARLVFKVAYGVLRNSHDAEDVVQETFLRAHREGMERVRDAQAWLATVAFRLAIDRKRKPEGLDIAELEVASAEPDAERLAIRHEQVERVQKLIASLPEELRYPLVLSALEELSSRQIAEVLGTNESSVRGRIMRARQLLKEKLAAQMETRR